MPARATSRIALLRMTFACTVCLSSACFAQQQTLGHIIGHIRVSRGDAPPERILVSLEVRGAPMGSAYTDSSGSFSFSQLGANQYTVVVDNEHYEPVRRAVVIDPSMLSPTAFIDITLVPKANQTSAEPDSAGANPNMIDARDYDKRFPKSATKEFKKGLSADSAGNKDEAIRHYEKAVTIAPDFFHAHNNLGSDYLSKSDFADARREFEQVVALNQSDAAGYFNLSNVCMLSGELPEAQRYLGEGLRSQPDSALGTFLRGSLDIREGKFADAEQDLHRAIELSPTMAQARLQLVNLFLREGRTQDAVSQLHDFVGAFPENPFTAQARQLLQKLESKNKPGDAVPN